VRSLESLFRAAVRSVVVAVAAGIAGCASFVPQPGPGAEPPGNFVDLTMPIIAVGDTQEHEATGYPLHDNDSALDGYIEVTQRPPEQPLFGRRVIEWALQDHPIEPWLHLGDVMDMSCRSEMDRLIKIFQAAGRPGAVLPGNHDGLLFGIYSYGILDRVLDPGAKRWNLACRKGGETQYGQGAEQEYALSKRAFIELYMASQAYGFYGGSGLEAPERRGEQLVSWRNPDPTAFLSGIEAHLVDGMHYSESFVAQRLRLPRAEGATHDVIVIGLDTNQASALASTWDTVTGRSPGSMGHIRLEQVRAVTQWVTEAARNGDIVIFAGHHNWQSLGLPTRALLGELMSNVRHPLVYLSAHTHRGFWATHRSVDGRPVLELNVSSLSDWPIAYRRISFAYDEKANRLLVRGDLTPHGRRPSSSDSDLMAAWETQTCDRSGFSSEYLRRLDVALVRQQRESRGSLINWLREAVLTECLSCELSRYENAQAYQNAMLETLLEVGLHLGPEAAELAYLPLPSWCPNDSYLSCARALIDEQPRDLRGHVDLFRRKSQLVDLLGDSLDALTDPRAKAYMTCRAVQAAKADFDATGDDRNNNRGESKRQAEQFFRVEASVGME
jgi:hypothetical protein